MFLCALDFEEINKKEHDERKNVRQQEIKRSSSRYC